MRKAGERCRGLALDDGELRAAEAFGVGRDQGEAVAARLDGDGAAGGVVAHPLDRDGAAAGADIPQELAGNGGEGGERGGADLPLGQLAVVVESLVRQAGRAGEQGGAGIGDAFDRERVEVGDVGLVPVAAAFLRAAHAFQDRDPALAVAAAGQQAGDGGRRGRRSR